MHNAQKVKLEFFGHSYYLTQKESDEVELSRVVAYVEKVAQKISMDHATLPAHKQIVLTVLSIAKDYLASKRDLDALENRIKEILVKLKTA